MPQSMELDMRQVVPVKELSKIMSYTIRQYKCSDCVHANKVLVSVSLSYHNLLLRFQRFEVIIESIVHCEAANAAVCLEHSLQYYLTFASASDFSDNLVCSLGEYTGITGNYALPDMYKPVLKINVSVFRSRKGSYGHILLLRTTMRTE